MAVLIVLVIALPILVIVLVAIGGSTRKVGTLFVVRPTAILGSLKAWTRRVGRPLQGQVPHVDRRIRHVGGRPTDQDEGDERDQAGLDKIHAKTCGRSPLSVCRTNPATPLAMPSA